MDEDYADEDYADESVPSDDYVVDDGLRHEAASSSSRAPPSDARGRLVVHLRSARGLRAADRGGTSDPYIELTHASVSYTHLTLPTTPYV